MKYYQIVCILIWLFLFSCKNEVKKDAPDVSKIEMNEYIIRFDREVEKLFNTPDVNQVYASIRQNHRAFTDIYFSNVLGMVPRGDSLPDINALTQFSKDVSVKKLQDTINIVMKDLSIVEKDLNQFFKYYKHYFPDSLIPKIYGCMTGFGLQRFIFDDDNNKSGIGLGLEMFLGNDFPYKAVDAKNPIFSDYLVRTFNKDHMVKKVAELLVDDVVGEVNGARMIDHMIHNGKKIYVLEKLLPFVHDTILLEYSPKQLTWCIENEKEMWAFFLDEKLFFETSAAKINKYINPAPSSQGMPAESPGRTANYFGWKIVKAYMKKYPQISLMQLLEFSDAQKLLEDSKFKPKR
jgi:hypothetical protein